jgi:hypothetical protein
MTRSSGKNLPRLLSWNWETGNNCKLIIRIFSDSDPYSIRNGRISTENTPKFSVLVIHVLCKSCRFNNNNNNNNNNNKFNSPGANYRMITNMKTTGHAVA